MYKVLFIVADMEVGGVERAAIPLLHAFNSEGWDITLRLFSKGGPLLKEIPKKVKIETESHIAQAELMRHKISEKLQNIDNKTFFIFSKKIYHMFGRILIKREKKCTDYDLIIAYQDGLPTWYVVKTFPYNKKIAFVHTDFHKANYNRIIENQVYSSFDIVVFPTNRARDSFLSLVTYPINQTLVLQSTLNIEHIKELAKKSGFDDEYNGIRILTVGRLSHEKGVRKIVPLMYRLRNAGINARWYLVGDGPLKEQIYEDAVNNSIADSIILLGKKENPYSYMLQCDIYVQPSDYESYCLSLAEARCLACPIISCDFIGAREQITNGQDGFIVGFSIDDIYKKLFLLATNSEIRSRFNNALLSRKEEGSKNELLFVRELKKYVNE